MITATNLIDFSDYKRRFNTEVVYVGDVVEWQDYTGETYISEVLRIEHKALEGFDFGEESNCFPIWEKAEYIVFLRYGMTVAGSTLVRKIVKKRGIKVKVPDVFNDTFNFMV